MKYFFFNKKFNNSFQLSSTVGNLIEWYDFGLYSFLIPVFNKVFFMDMNKKSIFLLFLIFSAGFLSRPFGAILFGHLGDKLGRKKALLVSITLISISTALIGLLPSYSTIGITAPMLLLILRVVQGIAVSGEGSGVSVFLLESAKGKEKIIASCSSMTSVYLGLLISAIVTYVIFQLDPEQIIAWGWRIPYLFSLLFGIIAFILRYLCVESLEYSQFVNKNQALTHPISYVIKHYYKEITLTIFSSSLIGVISYLLSTFFPNYISNRYSLGFNKSILVAIIPLILILFSLTLFRKYLFRFHTNNITMLSIIGILIVSVPVFYYGTIDNLIYNIISLGILGIIISPFAGSIFKILCELYPVKVRYSGVSLGYNISMTIFGGTAPAISLLLINTGNPLIPAFYLMFISSLTLLSLFIIFSNHKKTGNVNA